MNANKFLKLFFLSALIAVMFTTCKKDDNNKGEFIVSGTISGEHANWTEVSVSVDFGETWAETAPILNGKFSIKLPIPSTQYLIPLEIEEYPDKIEISDKNVKVGTAAFFVSKGDQTEILTLKDASILPLFGAGVVATYVYADKNVNISGTIDEKNELLGISIKTVVDQKYKKGWNTLVVTSSGFLTGNWTITSKTDNVPSGVVWVVDGNPLEN